MSEDPEAVLARWRAEEAAVRAAPLRWGIAEPGEAMGLSGPEVFEHMFDGRLPMPPMAKTLGFIALSVEPGRAVFQGAPALEYYNPLGSVHGGWFASLLDSCVGCAVHSTLEAGKGYTTVELSVNIVRAITDRVPLVRAEGWIVHRGGQVATAEGRLTGPDGRLYAHATTTCLVFDARP